MSLDDKLREILITEVYFKDESTGGKDLASATAIAQIKQAFTDAGYINLRGAVSSGPKYQSSAYRGDGARLMTGQDFYNRFENGLENYVGHSELTAWQQEVLNVAKIAAGITNE